ncbi:CHAT domain-containing protein [Polaribacter sp. 11A2H]|uniref:CHAT domain-containing protein n=1 Tax=Polaribacter sp. 11A2H TaxID=2687290 RepID=UPI00140B0E0A|nr:CHAT domain-containing protein [Polaribacter sp. 11A2H]
MYKNKIIWGVLIILIFTSKIFSQIKNDTLIASKYYNKADSLQKTKNYNKANIFYKKALPIYKKNSAWKRTVDCYNRLSQINRYNRKLESSLSYAKTALELTSLYLPKESEQAADTYHNIGFYYYGILDLDKTIYYLNKSLVIRQKIFPKNHPKLALSYNSIGATYNKKGKFELAISYFKKALKINILHKKNKEISSNYNNIGTIYTQTRKLNLALKYFKKSLEIKKKNKGNILHIGTNMNNIAITLIELQRFDEGLDYLFKAIPILNNKKGERFLTSTYQFIAIVYRSKGEDNKALQYFNKSLNISLNYYKENHPITSDIISGIASIYTNKADFENGIIFEKRALNNYINVYGEKHPKVSNSYQIIGYNLSSKKEYAEALKYLKIALKINKDIFGNNNPITANSYKLLANFYNKKEDYNSALKYYKKGLEIIQNNYGVNHILTSNFYFRIGIIHQNIKEYQLALNFFNKALKANSKKINDTYYDYQLALNIVHKKAQTLNLYYLQTKENNNLNQSIQLYYQADIIIDYIRQSFNNHQDKLLLSKQAKAIYADAIASHLLKYKNTKENKYLEDAWYFSEKSKSNTLKDLLNDASSKKFSGIPDTLLEVEKNIRSNRAYYQSQIVSERSKNSTDSEIIKHFEDELFAINQKNDSLIKILEKEYPKYYQLSHKNKKLSITDIQKKINKNTTILEFFTTEDRTYAFTISKKNISIKEFKVSELSKKIDYFRNTITSENIEDYKKTASSLYKELIKPIKDKLIGDNLIIIPDGSLWYLNFDLLLTKEAKKENTRNLFYLLKKYTISYANTIDLLFNPINNKKQSKIRKECLAFSFSNETNIKQITTLKEDLPGTRKELKAISKIIDGQYFYDSEAAEANFKKNADKYNILHLALHGEVDDEHPQESRLYFTESKDSIEDNILYNHELFALNIPADLVVLSACDTGIGKIANGEGLMSLGNAFQYAGAKSLLLSRWKVSDKTTPELMKFFYSNLKKGMTKPKALQQAKLNYLKTTEAFYTNPFYWGSFYIIGNTDAIPFNNDINNRYYWIIGILFCLFSIYYFNKNKRHKLK